MTKLQLEKTGVAYDIAKQLTQKPFPDKINCLQGKTANTRAKLANWLSIMQNW